MKIRILQLKDLSNTDYAFMDYDYAKKHNFNLNDYKIVYEYEKKNNIWLNDIMTLEETFTTFNCYHPDDFKGHSLSVSDVVTLDDRYYYVDSIGFTKIK